MSLLLALTGGGSVEVSWLEVEAAATGITATLAVVLDGISFDGAIVSGHSATIAFALDGINVAMTAINSGAPPTPGFVQTLIEIRSFTERRF